MVPGNFADHEALVAFVHIPKTAGTTLASFLHHQYGAHEVYSIHRNGSAKQLRRFKAAMKHCHGLRLIQGHFDLSLSRWLPRDTRFFTLLRDPVERAISHYYHYRRLIGDPIHQLAMQSSLTEWVSGQNLLHEMDNGQTRRLAGRMDIPIGKVGPETLELAKNNLRKFVVVGLTERFEESQVLLHRAFAWPRYRYVSRNVGENRVARSALEAGQLQAIVNSNTYDLELYRFASDLFEETVTRIDMRSELALLAAAPVYVPAKKKISTKPAPVGALSRLKSTFLGLTASQTRR